MTSMHRSIALFVLATAGLAMAFSLQDKKEAKRTVSILGVGDIMLGTHFPSSSYLPPNDGSDIFNTEIQKILLGADVAFGNLEGAFLDDGPVVKKCSDPSKCYAFKTPTSYSHYLKDMGFDVISVANNHVGDFGDLGRNSTKKELDNMGIRYAGLLTCPKAIFTIDSVVYGFAAFSPNNGTCRITDIKRAVAIVQELEDTADIVIVSFHGGAEGSKYQHMPKETETFYGENRGNVYEFSHSLIDAGADVVFGHGPHVTRAVELYKDRFIAYSLGNFATYGRFNLSGANGIAPIIEVYTDLEGRFEKAGVYSIEQIGEGYPRIDPDHAVFEKLKELTESDLPETPLIFENNQILRKNG